MNPLSHNPSGLLDGQTLPTKSNAELMGKQIAADCRNGFADNLETVARLRAIMLACETALAELEADTLDAISKFPNGKADVLCAKIERVEAGTKYDYAGTGDPTWLKLKADATLAAEALKMREQVLKAIKKPIQEADEETGELVEVRPPQKTSKTTYKVTLDATPIPNAPTGA